MKILKPIKDGKFTETNNLRNSIFLAGPCPREKDHGCCQAQAFWHHCAGS